MINRAYRIIYHRISNIMACRDYFKNGLVDCSIIIEIIKNLYFVKRLQEAAMT